LQRVNHEQQLLEFLKDKSEHTDEEDKTLILLLVPVFKKLNDDQSTGQKWQ
jgi:hypothetical protein